MVIRLARRTLAALRHDPDPVGAYYRWLDELEDRDLAGLLFDALSDPALTLRPEQELPQGDWYVWLKRTGRGWGKNHAASVAINQMAEFLFPGQMGLIVGATVKDVRSTIFGGESGLAKLARPSMVPRYVEHNAEIVWPNGSKAAVRTGDNPQDIRGLSVPWAYCDELIKWQGAEKSWKNVRLCVREGDQPRIIVTSTPLRGAEWMRKIESEPHVHLTTGKSTDNVNLPKVYFSGNANLDAKTYQEEVSGEWASSDNNLWTREQLTRATLKSEVPLETFVGTLDRRAITIDPSGGQRDLTGMTLIGQRDDDLWVLSDLTLNEPVKQSVWIAELRLQVAKYLRPGDYLLVETNGAMGLDSTLQEAFPNLYVEPISRQGKNVKCSWAEGVQALYVGGRVRHFSPMPRLEQQMVDFYDVVDSAYESPDRVDAMVNGLRWLNENAAPAPFVMDWGTQTPWSY